jgi:hypothetical protein
LEEILLIKQDAFAIYELDEFKAKQELRKQYVISTLTKSWEDIASVVLKVFYFI